MLDKWLQTLEQEKQKAIERVRTVCTDTKTIDLAIREIEINYMTLKTCLERMHKLGYKVNDDLSRIEQDYNSLEDYRRFMNHVAYHFAVLKDIPTQVERGEFEPQFAEYY